MIGLARAKASLYYLDGSSVQESKEQVQPRSCLVQSNKDRILLYHSRFGHPSFSTIRVMFPALLRSLNVKDFQCSVCELAKHKRVTYPSSNKRNLFPFSLIHSDVWGPTTVPNISGAQWFILFVDDCTRVVWLFLMKHKSEVSTIFPSFYNMIKTQFGVEIKRLRSDNAKDFF